MFHIREETNGEAVISEGGNLDDWNYLLLQYGNKYREGKKRFKILCGEEKQNLRGMLDVFILSQN